MRHEERTGYLVRVHVKGNKRNRWDVVIPDTTCTGDIFVQGKDGLRGFRIFPNSFLVALKSFGELQSFIRDSTEAPRVSFYTENTFSSTQKPITQVSNVQVLNS